MSKIAMFKYKCRNCGVVYREDSIRYDLAYGQLYTITHGADYFSEDELPSETDVHECDKEKNNVGVADLIGYQIVES